MAQPSSKPAWVPSDDPAKVIEPSVSKKNTGWASEEKPPFQYFNWFWNTLSKWINWFNGTRKFNIVISSDSDEADFSTLAAYIAGTPVAGDRVLVKNDQTLTATLTLPADVEIEMIKSKKFTLSTVFTPIINIGNRSSLIGDWEIEAGHTGTIANGIVFNGDDAFVENIRIENITTGIITDAFEIAAGKIANQCEGRSTNTGAGSITNNLVNSSTNSTNNITIRTDSGIETTGSANLLDGQNGAYYLARANHTGTQTVSTLSNHNKTVHDALNIDAETLDGINSTDFLLVANEKVRAWVNFSGSGAVAIRQSHNVSSITDNGVGDYTVNYTSALTDGNGAIHVDAGDQDTVTVGNGSGYWGASSTTSVNIQTFNVIGAAVQDYTAVGVTVCR